MKALMFFKMLQDLLLYLLFSDTFTLLQKKKSDFLIYFLLKIINFFLSILNFYLYKSWQNICSCGMYFPNVL